MGQAALAGRPSARSQESSGWPGRLLAGRADLTPMACPGCPGPLGVLTDTDAVATQVLEQFASATEITGALQTVMASQTGRE